MSQSIFLGVVSEEVAIARVFIAELILVLAVVLIRGVAEAEARGKIEFRDGDGDVGCRAVQDFSYEAFVGRKWERVMKGDGWMDG